MADPNPPAGIAILFRCYVKLYIVFSDGLSGYWKGRIAIACHLARSITARSDVKASLECVPQQGDKQCSIVGIVRGSVMRCTSDQQGWSASWKVKTSISAGAQLFLPARGRISRRVVVVDVVAMPEGSKKENAQNS